MKNLLSRRRLLQMTAAIESLDRHVSPRSLYLSQLRDRLGERAVEGITAGGQKAW